VLLFTLVIMIECLVLGHVFGALLCAPCVIGDCGAAPRAQAPKRDTPSYTVTVSAGSRAAIPEEALTIELTGVKDDRCAAEVKCVWAGSADITLQVSKAGAAPASLTIATAAPPQQGGPTREPTYDSYRFSVVGLEPGNSMSKPVAQSQYRATVGVSKLSR
jgi:hypothetical protein